MKNIIIMKIVNGKNGEITAAIKRIGFVLGLLLLGTSIFTACAKKFPQYPQTFDAQIITSLDPENTEVIARGTWDHVEGAIVEAKMNAMWAVINTLAQTDEEKRKVEANKVKIFSNPDKYVRQEGGIKRTRTPDGRINVEMKVIVRKKLLEDDLVSAGLIQKREEIIEVLENPSIVVIPDEKVKNQGWVEFGVNEVNSYFTTKKFEILNPDTIDKLYQMAEQIGIIEGLPQDPAAKIALSVGADIYVVVEGKFEEGQVGKDRTTKAAASLKAFETTTGRLIGSSTGFSKEVIAGPGKDRVTLSEAIRDAADKLITQIMDYWKSDIKKGKQFLIFVYGNFENLQRQADITSAIKNISADYKREVASKNLMTFRVWYKGKSDEIIFSLQDELSKRNLKLTPTMQNRKMIQIKVD
jgi:nucleoid DNA-binding protein